MPEIPFALQIQEDRLLPLKESVNGKLYSAVVSNIPEFEYCLEIDPNGNDDDHRGKTYMFLQLKPKNVKKVEADFTITIESANDSKKLHYIYENWCGYGPFICKTDKFFDPENKYIVDEKFTIKVNGTFKFENEDAQDVGNVQKWDGGELGDESWEKDDAKDFSIIVDGKEIKVRKFIPGIRSVVFTAMLNADMKEAAENKVEITDFPYKVVETGIKLIYNCNFVFTLSIDELMLLLQFFDKYQLSSLKAKVEPYLIGQISAATVCNLTNASIQTNSFKLKEKCMEFLSACFKQQIPLSDIDSLDKDVLLETIKNSLYQIVDTN